MAGVEHLWAHCVSRLRQEFPESTWNVWLAVAQPLDLADHRLVLRVPSLLFKDRFEARYLGRVRDLLEEVTGEPHEVVLEVGPDGQNPEGPESETPQFVNLESGLDEPDNAAAWAHVYTDDDTGAGEDVTVRKETRPRASAHAPGPEGGDQVGLKPTFTFETFVIGESNRFAHAAALAVAEDPAQSWNPLFIYGDTGLGKTHLLHAIAHYVNRHYPLYNVHYVSTEVFLNEFIEAIRTNRMSPFKRRYRECDVLLIDDVQFIENKERFQEEFFHTFDSLHSAGRQIVISSDRPPKAIATLEDRLRSRFGGGLITDVQAPDLETRLAILRKKAEREPFRMTDEVLDYIATHITSNIRELEGALVRVSAFGSLNRIPMTAEIAAKVLSDLVQGNEPRQITPRRILEVTSDVFGHPIEELTGKSRSRPLVQARQISMYVFRELTDFSYPAIGRVFGNRDHTTVMHAVDKISKLMQERLAIYEQVTALMQRLRSGG